MHKIAVLSFTTILLASGAITAAAAPAVNADDAGRPTATTDLNPALQQQGNGTLGVRVDRSGDTLTVTLTATGTDIAGYQANLTFDPDVVQYRSASGVDFSDPVANADQTAGWVFLTQAAADGTDDPTLVRVSFEIVGDGDPGVGFDQSNTLLNDADAENVDAGYETDAVSGLTVTTTSPTPTASPSPTPSPTGTSTTAVGDTATTAPPADTTVGGDGAATDDTDRTDESDGGLLSNTFLLGLGAGLGVVLLLGVGLLVGMRLGD